MSYGNKFIRHLYDLAPYPVKTIFTSIYGLRQRQTRYGNFFEEEIKLLKKSQYWDSGELLRFQFDKLTQFFKEIRNVPYYKENPVYRDLDPIEMSKYPIIPRYIVKENPSAFYNRDKKDVVWYHTSGTSGSAMNFPLSIETWQYEYAFRYMQYMLSGVDLCRRDKIAICASHPVTPVSRTFPPFWSYDAANNHLYFSSYHFSMDNMVHYIRKLEEFNPMILHGFPSSIYLLALAYQKYGRKKLDLRAIYTSSENLLDFQRKRIEEAFQVKVYNWYGNGEKCAFIVECEKGELHLRNEYSFTEILNREDHPCKPGETGRVVSTNYNNPAFPLIRYDIGDLVTVAENQISQCGRSGLLIDKIDGRKEEYILTPEGKIVGLLDP
ncbi:MAG: hypothetical protein Q8859_07885, partial [Bacteroidota bacterium]|nr:hypothetical protein [Bacteroidota bacterium]